MPSPCCAPCAHSSNTVATFADDTTIGPVCLQSRGLTSWCSTSDPGADCRLQGGDSSMEGGQHSVSAGLTPPYTLHRSKHTHSCRDTFYPQAIRTPLKYRTADLPRSQVDTATLHYNHYSVITNLCLFFLFIDIFLFKCLFYLCLFVTCVTV